MTEGLAILAAWVEFALIVGLLAWTLLRHGQSDPLEEARHPLTDREDQGP
jgi:hypothetical protein